MVLDGADCQADVFISPVFIATDELGLKGSAAVYLRSDALGQQPGQIAHLVDAEADVGLAISEINAGQSGLNVRKRVILEVADACHY